MRILFFPSDLGGGFGHISRCLAVAREARQRGHICSFVTGTKKYHPNLSIYFQVFTVKADRRWNHIFSKIKTMLAQSTSHSSPLFTEFSGLDFQALRDGFFTVSIVEDILNKYIQIVKEFKPDLLIGDTNLLVWILSQKVSIPVVQIVRYASHPATAKLFWWKKEPEGLVPPNSSLLFNPILKKMDLPPIKRAEDLLQGDLYIVPSIPELEPAPIDAKTVHVGELTTSRINNQIPSWFQEIDSSQPLVYVTIGGGAGPVGSKQFFNTILEAFTGQRMQVIVSTSSKFNMQDIPCPAKNIRFYNWLPGKFMISRASLVIFHGGYGTMMESVACGKPTITIPYHSEQEGNGRRLEQAGCGLVEKLSRDAYKRIDSKWEYGTYSFLVQKKYNLTAEELTRDVNEVLFNARYLYNAQRIQSIVKEYHGPRKTMELIEECWD